MGTGRAAVVLGLLGVTLLASDPPPPVGIWEAVFRDAAILEDLGTMVRQADARVNAAEIAAFLVRSPGGELALARWPDSWSFGSQRFRGSIPPGAIAIVHTHPPRRSPRPSISDGDLARSSGLPVVALSRRSIWIIQPDADEPVELVARRNWTAQPTQLALK